MISEISLHYISLSLRDSIILKAKFKEFTKPQPKLLVFQVGSLASVVLIV